MCIDFKTSITSFIVGTVFNVFIMQKYKNVSNVIAVCIAWQWALFMQLSDAIAWVNLDDAYWNNIAAKSAFLLNVLQPIVLYLLMIYYNEDKINKYHKIIAACIILIYIAYLLYASNKIDEINTLKPTNNCDHLVYNWWGQFPLKGIGYLLIFFPLLLLLIKPFKFSLLITGYVGISLIISAIYYQCSISSIWCFLTAFAPLFTGLFWSISQ